MGVHGLKKIISQSGRKVQIGAFAGAVFGIDASVFIYKFMNQRAKSRSSQEQVCCQQMIRMCKALQLNGTTPIMVFDGKPSSAKGHELAKRRKVVDNAVAVLKSSGLAVSESMSKKDILDVVKTVPVGSLTEECKTSVSKLTYVSPELVECLKEALGAIGVTCVQADGEADHALAKMSRDGVINCVVSQDMDMLAHGVAYLVTDFESHDYFTTGYVTLYCLDEVLSALEITYLQFVDMCIMMGCDYTNKLPGVGPITALKDIKRYGNIEGLLVHISPPEDFDYQTARAEFVMA